MALQWGEGLHTENSGGVWFKACVSYQALNHLDLNLDVTTDIK